MSELKNIEEKDPKVAIAVLASTYNRLSDNSNRIESKLDSIDHKLESKYVDTSLFEVVVKRLDKMEKLVYGTMATLVTVIFSVMIKAILEK